MTLTRSHLLAYAAPALPLAILGFPLYVYIPTMYAESTQLSIALIGAMLLAARLLDVITDPLIGTLSDHWRTRGDARAVPMLLGLPLLLGSIYALFHPPADADLWHLLLSASLAYLGWTLISVPYLAWGAELSPDRHQRTRVTAYREAFVIAGVVGSIALAGLSDDPNDYPSVLNRIFFVLLVLLPLGVSVCVFTVHAAARTPPVAWREGWRLLRANRPLRVLLLSYFLNGVANGFPATLFLLFAAHVLQAPDAVGLLLGTYFAAGALAIPLWLYLSRRYGKRNTWCLAMSIACLAFAWVPLLDAGDLTAFVAICVVTGCTLGADLALPPSMQADVVEFDARNGGGNRAGLLFGLWGMATKLALAMAVGIAFPLLDLSGFDAAQADNGSSSLTALALLYGIAPVCVKAMAIATILGYPDPSRKLDHAISHS